MEPVTVHVCPADQHYEIQRSHPQFFHLEALQWGFFRRRSAIFCEGDQQFCDSDQESERSDAGAKIVSKVIEMVKEKKSSILSRG